MITIFYEMNLKKMKVDIYFILVEFCFLSLFEYFVSYGYVCISNYCHLCIILMCITAYSSGTEYVYDYESQAVSGLPVGAKTYSGLKIKSQVLVQMISDSKMKLQVFDYCLVEIKLGFYVVICCVLLMIRTFCLCTDFYFLLYQNNFFKPNVFFLSPFFEYLKGKKC